MSKMILILGSTGTGKSTSLRNFKKGEAQVIACSGKDLPIRSDVQVAKPSNYTSLYKAITATTAPVVVIDDLNYMMVADEFARAGEKSYDKFTDFAVSLDNVFKLIKAKDADPDVLAILKKYDKLSTEEKELKKKIKAEAAELQMKTKATIEALTDEEAYALLRCKWIEPITVGLKKLPGNIVTVFAAKLEALSKKYETTYSEVEQQIKETEGSLSVLIDQLTGSEFDLQGLYEFKKLLGGEE